MSEIKYACEVLAEVDALKFRLAESERHRQILTRQNHELLAKNRALDHASRAMLAGDIAAHRMLREALSW